LDWGGPQRDVQKEIARRGGMKRRGDIWARREGNRREGEVIEGK